jgi:iron complex outermembrane recepter protein
MDFSRQLNIILALTLFLVAPALAQDRPPVEEGADNGDVDSAEIVVTATRRNKSVQKTPLSISVLTGDALQQRPAFSISPAVCPICLLAPPGRAAPSSLPSPNSRHCSDEPLPDPLMPSATP